MVVGEWLDDQPGAVLPQRFMNMARRTDRIAHVMETVEEGDKVIPGSRIILCRGDVETDAIGDPGDACRGARSFDRRAVVVVSDKAGIRERLRHDDRR